MKKLIIKIFTVFLLLIITTVVVSYIALNGNKILKNFNIISVDNISTNYKITFEKVKAATNYDIVIYNESNNKVFYKENIKDTSATINLKNIAYNEKYKLVVYAYDKLNDSITVNNPYTFTYTEPTFNKDNNLVLTNNEDYTLLLEGDLTKKNYYIGIYDKDYEIKKERITTNEYIIPQNLFNNIIQKLTVKLFDNNNVINTIDLYSNLSPVSDIKITSPINNTILDYNDVAFTYEGGENADKYLLQIYKGKTLIKEAKINNKRVVVNSEFFDKSQKYKVVISGLYKDYKDLTKKAEISFEMNSKDTLKPAYIDKYYKYIKEGDIINIINPNKKGKIYYTLDGSDPINNGIEYTTPLEITNNSTLKTVVMEDNMNNSIVNVFDLNIGKKDIYKIYLSPSNQDANIGISEVGYTNEMKEMNDLTSYIEAKLKEYPNIKIYRNSPNGNINIWNQEATYYNCDFKIAIHSNASTAHKSYGIETWIDEQKSASYSIANIIQKDLVNIYYNKEDEKADRGVKYANGSLGEANDNYFPLGLLVEVAHHDYREDALWIMSNKKLIGDTIANSIINYFSIK